MRARPVRTATPSHTSRCGFSGALQLSANERAKLAAELLSSLDDEDAGVKSAWAAKIARRAADAEADPDDEEDWRAALEDIRHDALWR